MSGRLEDKGVGVLPVALAVLLAGAVAWVGVGWQLEARPVVGAVAPEFPGRALLAGLLGGLVVALLLLAGTPLHLVLAPRVHTAARLSLFFLAGACAVSVVTGFTSFMGIWPVVALAVAGGMALWGHGAVRRPLVRGWRPEWWLVLVPTIFVAVAALAPPVESDGIRYHLVTAQEWLRAGHFVNLPYNANSNLPALQSLLAAHASGGWELGRVYQLLHAAHFLAMVLVAGELTRRLARAALAPHRVPISAIESDGGLHGATAIGAVAVVAIPAVTAIAAWPFADLASAAYLLAGVLAAIPGTIRGGVARAALASLFLGASVAAKISNLPLAGIVGLYMLLRWLPGRNAVALLVGAFVPGLLILAPWLIKNAVHHGNPLYPLAYGLFGGPEWSPENEQFYASKLAEKGVGHGLAELLLSPWNMTRHWTAFEAHNPGPMLLGMTLLLAPAIASILARGRRSPTDVRLLPAAMVVLGWIVWFKAYQSVRFFLPVYTIGLALAIAWLYALALRSHRLLSLRIVVAAVAIPGIAWTIFFNLCHRGTYQAALGRIAPDLFITARLNSYPAIQWLNSEARDNEPVVYIGEYRAFHAESYTPLSSDFFDTPLVLADIRATSDNAALLQSWRDRGVRYVLMNLSELALYKDMYFRHRFTDDEWQRFEDLLATLQKQPRPFDDGRGVVVTSLREER